MIVRILGEGQYAVAEDKRDSLAALDVAVADAVDSGDEQTFSTALAALTTAVRTLGEELADDAFAPSDLVVPFADSTLDETKVLLAEADDTAGTDDR